MLSEEAIIRRNEEIAALSAYYDDDFQASLIIPSSSSSSNTIKNSNSSNDDDENSAVNISIEGPWFIKLGNNGYHHHHGLLPTLEIRLPNTYPCDGAECPVPILHNVIMKPELKNDLLDELQMMWEVDMDVGILWGERCREEICLLRQEEDDQVVMVDGGVDELYCSTEDSNGKSSTSDAKSDDDDIQTFIPPTTRYNQPIRHFPTSIINNPKYRRTIIHTPPFHPPKSGPSENMIAHVCSVTCIEHVQWALAELLFNDKKVGKATHNMFAYRFYAAEENNNDDNDNEKKKKSTLLVKDNDDDGEKGSGAKLASLLELSSAENVLVVVSRWYGGQLLGPSRFKWIAGVARNGLVQGGFIEE